MKAHLVMAPILLPFIGGIVLLVLSQAAIATQRWVALLSVLTQVVAAITLLMVVSNGDILVYRLGDWPAPWGIVMVADQLAAWMVLVTSLLALPALVFAGGGVDTQGRHFHVLFQMQLFGLAGAFLTGDLFNLFVFFEILLISSYGLALHGGGAARTRAGLHYVVMNLAGSAVFLLAAGLIYAAMGSLNLADLATKAATLDPDQSGAGPCWWLVAVAGVWLEGGAAATAFVAAACLCRYLGPGGCAVCHHDQGRYLRHFAHAHATFWPSSRRTGAVV
jgi:multicomponent K+:H+ antiporter subunit D